MTAKDMSATTATGYYFPPRSGDAWERVAPEDAGWDARALDELAEWAGTVNTTGLVLLHRGRILMEAHFGEGHAHFTRDVASCQKSFTSFLVGTAQESGLLAIGDPVTKYLGEGWSRSPAETERLITIRHLITMSSGLSTLIEVVEEGRYALKTGYEADAGTKWFYNTAAYQMSKNVLERATGLPLQQYTEERLSRLIGLQDAAWRPRTYVQNADGVPYTGMNISAREMARFGLLMLANGEWDGSRIIEAPHLAESFSNSQPMNLSYGYLWWLNGQESHMFAHDPTVHPGWLIPTAPADLVAAKGNGDNRIYVVPSLDLVAVRHGSHAFGAPDPVKALERLQRPQAAGPGEQMSTTFDIELWRRIMVAAPG